MLKKFNFKWWWHDQIIPSYVPTYAKPVTTWSENSEGQTQVLTSLNLTSTGQLQVSSFKPMKLDPPISIQYFQWFIKHSKPNSARSHRDLVQILRDPARSRRYLMKSKSDLIKPETNPIQPKIDETWTSKSDQIFRVNFGLCFHPPRFFELSPS